MGIGGVMAKKTRKVASIVPTKPRSKPPKHRVGKKQVKRKA